MTGRRAPQADRDRGAGDPQEGEGAHVDGEAPGGGGGIQGADHRGGEEVRELELKSWKRNCQTENYQTCKCCWDKDFFCFPEV